MIEICQVHLIRTYTNENGKLIPDKLNEEDAQAFNMLMLQGSEINDDSYGYFTPEIVKRVPEHYKSRAYQEVVDAPFVVGHNRFTTKGSSTKKNAHPFQSSRFIWVHNGILDNDEKLRKQFKIKIKAKVDSAVIGHLVEHYVNKKKTIENAIKSAIEQISGDYSIFLFDKITKRLFYLRNSMRKFETALLHEKNTNRYVLIGSTDGDNIDNVYTERLLNFDIQKMDVLSRDIISSNTIFEVNGNGFENLIEFTPKEKKYIYPYNTIYKPGMNEFKDANDYESDEESVEYKSAVEQELDYSTIETFKTLTESLGFDLLITPHIEINIDHTEQLSGAFISGKDTEEFMDVYNDFFSDSKNSTMTAQGITSFITEYEDFYKQE